MLSTDEYIMSDHIRQAVWVIGIISACCNILVALSYYSKKARAHPSFLVFMIAICECAATIYMIYGSVNVSRIIESFGLNKVLYYLTFHLDLRNSSDYTILDRNTELLCEANNMLMNFFSLGSIIFNICLCIDLLLSLRMPFAPPQKRNKFFLIGMIVISFGTVFLLRETLKFPCRKGNFQADRFQYRSTPATAFFLLIFVIIGLISVLYAWKRINNTYGSQGRTYFIKHFAYVICFIVIWTFYAVSSGIFTFCYFSVENSDKMGNAKVYDECFKKNPLHKDLLAVLTNVAFAVTVDRSDIGTVGRDCSRRHKTHGAVLSPVPEAHAAEVCVLRKGWRRQNQSHRKESGQGRQRHHIPHPFH